MKILIGVLFVGTFVVFNSQLVVAQTGDGLSTSSDVDSTGDNSHPASTNVGTASYPRIDSDCRVTFRLMAPNADKVQVFTNYGLGTDGPWDMSKDEDGVWMTWLILRIARVTPLKPNRKRYDKKAISPRFCVHAGPTALPGPGPSASRRLETRIIQPAGQRVSAGQLGRPREIPYRSAPSPERHGKLPR